jgi:hypothetical protein
MCLKIGNVDYCLVLRGATHYKGRSLESLQHNLEENHEPHDPDLYAAIAQACGLSLAAYRKRCAVVRGENALKQLQRARPQDIGQYGSYFTFPKECGDYVQGKVHEYPDPETLWLEPEAAEQVFGILSELRFQWFRWRVATGDRTLVAVLAKYPERISYLLKLRANGRTQDMYTMCLRMMEQVGPRATTLTAEIRLTGEEIEFLVALRVREFLASPWPLDRFVLGQLFTTEELGRLDTFVSRRRNLYKPGLKKTRSLRLSRRTFHAEFERWSEGIRAKYETAFRSQLRQRFVLANLTPEHGTSPGADRTQVTSASYASHEKSTIIEYGGDTFGLPTADFLVLAQQALESAGCQVIAAPAAA